MSTDCCDRQGRLGSTDSSHIFDLGVLHPTKRRRNHDMDGEERLWCPAEHSSWASNGTRWPCTFRGLPLSGGTQRAKGELANTQTLHFPDEHATCHMGMLSRRLKCYSIQTYVSLHRVDDELRCHVVVVFESLQAPRFIQFHPSNALSHYRVPDRARPPRCNLVGTVFGETGPVSCYPQAVITIRLLLIP